MRPRRPSTRSGRATRRPEASSARPPSAPKPLSDPPRYPSRPASWARHRPYSTIPLMSIYFRDTALGELLAHELTDGAPVSAAGDLGHHVGHHAAHVAHARGLVLGDRVVDDPLEVLLGERRRHELLEDGELTLLLGRLLLAAGVTE